MCFVCLSVCLMFIYLFVCLFVFCLFICLLVCLSVCLSHRNSQSPFIRFYGLSSFVAFLNVHRFFNIRPSVFAAYLRSDVSYIYICLFVCLKNHGIHVVCVDGIRTGDPSLLSFHKHQTGAQCYKTFSSISQHIFII